MPVQSPLPAFPRAPDDRCQPTGTGRSIPSDPAMRVGTCVVQFGTSTQEGVLSLLGPALVLSGLAPKRPQRTISVMDPRVEAVTYPRPHPPPRDMLPKKRSARDLTELVHLAGSLNPLDLASGDKGFPLHGPAEGFRHGGIEVGDELFDPLLEMVF